MTETNFWDGKICPCDSCNGILIQKSLIRIKCQNCDTNFYYRIGKNKHRLISLDREVLRIERKDTKNNK